MRGFENAIVGVPGEGLNVEQRKRLTIGIEMAAKPELLLFLDEPTSGLDSQTAWTICTLLRKLADHGQTILCTIHQPSSLLLQNFDKILLIERGGQTVYFGDLGSQCRTMVSYLESKGARPLNAGESAAEWMMEVIGNDSSSVNWFEEWQQSSEKKVLKQEIAKISSVPKGAQISTNVYENQYEEFAVPLTTQIWLLLVRTFVEYWRIPAFLWAKFLFSCGAAIAISFSCWKSPTSLQGIHSQLFAIFTFYTILSNLMQQIVAQFLERRALFEAREGPSKTFSWMAFLISAAITEAVCQLILAVFTFVLFYYPIGMYLQIDKSESSERAGLMFLFFLAFLLFTSTFSHLLTVGMEHRETIVNIGSLLFYLILIFCGVLVPYDSLPKFWIFMYWISPFTYLVRGMFSAGVAKKAVVCSTVELLKVPIQGNSTCQEYLRAFVGSAGGKIVDGGDVGGCQYCPFEGTDDLLGMFNISYSERWINLGVLILFVGFNVVATFGVYWLTRVPKRQRMVET
ncbi:P-loop containing nucleoside triphosphate hydrolase [Glarea lozoyensis ATCC 20868]|uniref:p-loop containing nucleoside triphosphate hydrolase n=1 Tax=Glarea lozoyensis (strain ATCC 20868 / MF5171) TaxID=1116229 RepID=S3DLQ8_GLAL2|nr:P-loop containing nucleoside triphosphate hydrolase [Glarea lozoyensis ATCC 20868]EPE27473.1 P-loop containing nucleoside triphosphate hydrolase [Glarea lozoyensis ATCC 20868]